MRPTSVLLSAGLALLSTSVAAHAQRLSPIKAGKLLSLCENARSRTLCEAYVGGVADGIAGVQHMMSDQQGRAFAGSTCIPEGTGSGTLRSTVTDYLHAHTDAMDKPAAVPTFEALHAAFSCKSGG